MKKDEIIAFLQQQNVSLQEQLKNLTEEVSSLRNLLEQKTEEENKQKRIIKGLKKISQNKSEKQTPVSSSTEETPEQSCLKKERASTNNGAKRSRHPEVEVVEVDVEPDDPSFDAGAARLYRTRDVRML